MSQVETEQYHPRLVAALHARTYNESVADAGAERSLHFLLLQDGAAAGAVKGYEEQIKYYVRASRSYLKDKRDHMQLHVLYPFAFGKSNLPETSVFTAGSVR